MGFFNNILKKAGYYHKNEVAVYDLQTHYSDILFDKNGRPQFWNYNFKDFFPTREEFLKEGFGMNPYFFLVINDLAEKAAELPMIYQNYEDPSAEVTVSDELKMLIKNPNNRDTWSDLIYRAHASLMVTGECFFVGIPESFTDRYGMIIVPSPRNVTITTDNMGNPINYTITYFDFTFTIEAENTSEVLHIYRPNIIFDSDYGFSSLNANRFVYKSNNEIWKTEYGLQKNKGINGILTNRSGKLLLPEDKKMLQQEYDQESTGFNFGKVKVSQSNLDFLRMGVNPADLQSIQSREDHLKQACATFGVEPQLYGYTGASTYNNVQEMKKSRYINSLLPRSKKINTEFSAWLIEKNYGFTNICYKVDRKKIDALNGVDLEKTTDIVMQKNAGIITREEARAYLDPDRNTMPEVSTEEIEPTIQVSESQDQESLTNTLIELQTSVNSRIMRVEQARAILISLYGFTTEQARTLITEPNNELI